MGPSFDESSCSGTSPFQIHVRSSSGDILFTRLPKASYSKRVTFPSGFVMAISRSVAFVKQRLRPMLREFLGKLGGTVTP